MCLSHLISRYSITQYALDREIYHQQPDMLLSFLVHVQDFHFLNIKDNFRLRGRKFIHHKQNSNILFKAFCL